MILIKSVILYLCVPIWVILIYSFNKYNHQIIIPVSNMEDTTNVIMFSNNRINPNIFTEFNFILWIILVIWLFGMIVCFIKLINEKNIVQQLIRLNSEKNELLSFCLRNVQEKLNVKRDIDIFLNSNFPSPCLIHLKKPTIIIPDIYQNEEELTSFIYHEVYHLKGNDLYFLSVIKFLQTVFWFNPIIKWLNNYYSSYCEIACDHKVLQNFNNKQKIEYAILLRKALEHALK
ncbi:M56 family metallopeptidase, partial [Anaerorhabdus sp.]|uniref:M56 family metallopeptidase n=1 Tax=Anaerorhabdus sp. TaxID=1872524 RepID=UPI002FC99A09